MLTEKQIEERIAYCKDKIKMYLSRAQCFLLDPTYSHRNELYAVYHWIQHYQAMIKAYRDVLSEDVSIRFDVERFRELKGEQSHEV